MRMLRRCTVLVGLLLVLVGCGRIPPTSSAQSPSASPSARASALTVSEPTLHTGEIGVAYGTVTLVANGGTLPYSWMLSAGALPAGLTVSPAGVITGTPTAAGDFTFTVEVKDAEGTSANLASTIAIAPRLTASLSHSGTIMGRQGSAAGGAFATVSGGVTPYTYSVTAGALPAGTSLHELSLSGSYSTAGTYRFTVTVTDGLEVTAAVNPAYYVWGPIAFPPFWTVPGTTADQRFMYADVECRGTNATGCSISFPYSGGTPGVTPVISRDDTQAAWQGIVGYTPGQDSTLYGLSVTVSGGAIHVAVAPNANSKGWTGGKVFVVLKDPQTNETTRPAEIRITIFS
jgi:putative Ig domain-containing protein